MVVKVHQPPSCAELHRAAGLSGEGSVVGVFRCKDVHRLNLIEEGKLSKNFFSVSFVSTCATSGLFRRGAAGSVRPLEQVQLCCCETVSRTSCSQYVMCVLQDTLGQLCCVVLPFPMANRELDCGALDSTEGRDVHSLPNPEPVEQFSPTSSSLSDSSSSESSSTSISRPLHTEAVWPTLPVDVSNILINAGLDRPELLGFAFEN